MARILACVLFAVAAGCTPTDESPAFHPVPPDKMKLSTEQPAPPFSDAKPGVLVRSHFDGREGGTVVQVKELLLQPHKQVALDAGAATLYEVRAGKLQVTVDSKPSEVAAGGFFTVAAGKTVTLQGVGDEPVSLKANSFETK
jgi:quercetin dioxygenase-like cupin family protein